MLCVKCPNAHLLDVTAKYQSLVRCRRTRHCFGVCWHRCSDSRIGGETTQFKIFSILKQKLLTKQITLGLICEFSSLRPSVWLLSCLIDDNKLLIASFVLVQEVKNFNTLCNWIDFGFCFVFGTWAILEASRLLGFSTSFLCSSLSFKASVCDFVEIEIGRGQSNKGCCRSTDGKCTARMPAWFKNK